MFVHTVNRLPRGPVENVHQAILSRERQRRDALALHRQIQQDGRRRQVPVPQFVMNGLEMPAPFPGFYVHRHQRIAEQVVARPRTAVIVGRRTAEREIERAGFRVSGRVPDPHVGPRQAFPSAIQPRFMAELSRMRYGVECPFERAGTSIISAHVAIRPLHQLGRLRTDYERVTKYRGWIVILRTVPGNRTVVTEAGVDFSGRRIESDDGVVGIVKQARTDLASARPPSYRPAGKAGYGMAPEFSAAVRLERDDGIANWQVHHSVDDNGHRPGQRAATAHWSNLEFPGTGQILDVRPVYLLKRRKSRP